jgi:hypothetical protein
MATLTTAQVWQALEDNLFAVLGMVSAKNEARTAGIVYVVYNGKLFIASKSNAWKVRHVQANPHVSLTVTIPKSVPLMPWIKVPAATITFSGEAAVIDPQSLDAAVRQKLFRGLKGDSAAPENTSIIVVTPAGDFVTYGVGVSLMQMRDTNYARGRVPVR